MRNMILTFSLCVVFAATLSMRYPMAIPQTYGVNENGSAKWSDSINKDKGSDSPKLFAIIGDVQKFLTDRKIGINVLGDRYELLYKRIY